MELEDLVRSWATDERLVHLERLPARGASYAEPGTPLPGPVTARLGVDQLWAHQAEALDLARSGRSVVIATGTASGKSLCYQAAIGEAAWERPEAPGTALLLFPTKALARDQLRALAALELPGVIPCCYDGDAGPEERAFARAHATAVLSNPDMVHVGLLPHHARWATYLKRLRFVVVDELHTLRGVYGSHVAHLLRRLRRLCRHYGSDPTFIFASATIGEPAALAGSLAGLDVTAVTADASPRGERLFALWNPPMVDQRSGARASANAETAALVAELVEGGHRTIAFCASRKATELVAADAQRRLGRPGGVLPYRGGYLPAERRTIEDELFAGRLGGVIATNALELGIDVGGLDACVLDGFPGTIASLWQQAGRAGRSTARSLAVLVAGDDQLDQWLMAHPDQVFSRPPEPAVINPGNHHVLLPHLACAAYELPLTDDDERWWGEDLADGVRRLVLDDALRVRRRRAFWAGTGAPAWRVGLRSGSTEEFRIADADGVLIGTVDGGRAFGVVHPGAVYLHRGRAYEVTDLDLDERVATVVAVDGAETTQVRSETDVRIVEVDDREPVGGGVAHLGAVEVCQQVIGYQRRDTFTGEVLANVELDLPASRLPTRAVWWTFEPSALAAAGLAPARWLGTLHALEHAAIGMLPLFTICDRWDVGGVSTALQADTGAPAVVIYDGYPGGAGIAELGFAAGANLLSATLDLIAACPCASGCPSCVQSPKCGNLNEPLDKAGALALLRVALAPVGRTADHRLAG